jgi:TM2 domain-containing membrane protein YozV
MSDWYYVGHYGQLGPLTRDQVDELIDGGVIVRETYVWKTGMATWMPADQVAELGASFAKAQPFAAPPPPPSAPPMMSPSAATAPYGTSSWSSSPMTVPYYGALPVIHSDRSRVLAGILQLFLPGIGRIYLGYMAIGVLQLIFTIVTCTIGWLWPFIDGILILAGTPKLDGYGRVLKN